MAIVPDTKTGKVDFYQARAAVWAAAAATIGLSSADTTALSALVADAVDARAEAEAARLASKAATVTYHASVGTLARKGAELLHKIKAAAAASANPDAVWAAAQIPPPTLPAPVGAPGKPFDLEVSLNSDGSVVLRWKCNNPAASAGTMYNLRRRPTAGGAFAPIGGSGSRQFVDDTVVAGTTSVIYEITAVRSTRSGPSAEFVVNFGVAGSGEAFATVADVTAAKLAA